MNSDHAESLQLVAAFRELLDHFAAELAEESVERLKASLDADEKGAS